MRQDKSAKPQRVEKIRFSITRLKPNVHSRFNIRRRVEKIRFSITRLKRIRYSRCPVCLCEVEKIRFSITRLKQYHRRSLPCLWTGSWKDKILDYEIETMIDLISMVMDYSWKDKILDYEIETYRSPNL